MTIAEDIRDRHPRGTSVVSAPVARWERAAPPPPRDGGDGEYLDLAAIFRAARRQALIVALCVFAALSLAVAYIATAQPVYTAHGTILLDQERAELRDLVSAVPSAALGDAAVQSEVQILKSQELALRVVDRLELTQRSEELRMEPSLVDRTVGAARSAVGSALDLVAPDPAVDGGTAPDPASAEETARRSLATTLRNNLDVQRVGRSYVIDLSYAAPAPALAAEIATAYTDAYLRFQLEANRSTAESAVDWLEERVEMLRGASIDATRALEGFRRESGLVSVGERLLSEQELSEVMSQLILAEADTARARSEWAQARMMAGGDVDTALAALAEGPGGGRRSEVSNLRAEYLDTERRYREVVEEFGADHPEALRLERELGRTRTLVMEEAERRAESARNAFEAQESRVVALREGLDRALTGGGADEEMISRLRQLEHDNETYDSMYRDALTRLERATQQTSVPIVTARVITEPSVPKSQSSPSKARIIALGLFLGAFAGGGLGLLREMRRDAIDTRQDVNEVLGLPLLGTLSRRSLRQAILKTRRRWLAAHARTVPLDRADPDLLRTLRAVKLAVDEHAPQPGGRSVVFISPRPNDARTTLAVNFAAMLARYGFSTLLVDANPPALPAMELLGRDAKTSLATILEAEEEPAGSELQRIGSDPLFALPLSPADNPFMGIVQAGSERMSRRFHAYKNRFDYIVVDGAPASEGRDTQALSAYADVAVLTLRRRGARASTTREIVTAGNWRGKVAGVVLATG